jgi:hypothetical protein
MECVLLAPFNIDKERQWSSSNSEYSLSLVKVLYCTCPLVYLMGFGYTVSGSSLCSCRLHHMGGVLD